MPARLRDLWTLVPGVGGAVRRSAVLSLMRMPVLVGVPLTVRHIFDDAIPRRDGSAIALLGVLVLALYLVDAGVQLVQRRRAAQFATSAVADVRRSLAERLYRLPPSWHDQEDRGLLHAALVQDCERLLLVLTQLVAWIVPTLVAFLVLGAVAAVVAPALAAIVGTALLLALTLVLPVGRRTVDAGRRNGEAVRAISSGWRTALRLLPAAQAHGSEEPEIQRAAALAEHSRQAGVALQFAQARLVGVIDLVSAVMLAGTLVVAGIGLSRGWLTVGSMLSFFAVGFLLLRQLSSAGAGIASGLSDASSVERLLDLLSTDVPAPYAGTMQHVPRGGVELVGVSFGYTREQPVLQGLNLVIAPGEHIAVLGPNGAGKTTLVSLLLGMHRPTSGTVRLDGIAMDEIHPVALRQGIGLATQDPVLFAGTIAENIAYARRDATDAQIGDAAELATVSQFLPSLPNGIATAVGEEGVRLSGGQRQRVAIARALVGSPRLVILDEPTTYLDTASIDDLLERLDALPARPTVVTITHDPRIAARADRTVHLRDGRIVPEVDVTAIAPPY